MAVDLMIVGAAKSGTTSLLAYLGQHPAIQRPRQVELTWFGDPELYAKPFPEALYFGDAPPEGRQRVGKLAGLMYREDAIEKLRDLSPQVSVVAMLHDPVTRAYSAFWFARRRGVEPLTRFEDAIHATGDGDWWAERFRYLEGGTYHPYVERLHAHFGRDSVHVLIMEEFLADPRGITAPVLDRRGIDPSLLSDEIPRENAARAARSARLAQARRSRRVVTAARRLLPAGMRGAVRAQYRRVNESTERPPPMSPETELELRAYFDEPNRQLEELLGRPIPTWRRSDSST